MNTIDQGKDLYIIDLDRQHPYPGLFPFGEKHKDYFFGRAREIQELTRLIENNVLTVVFGKSGMGKTSLLQAGLIPWIRKNYYLPIYLRVNFDNREHPPINQVKDSIELKIKELDPQAPSLKDKTLWEYFSYTKILNDVVTPLLILDQLEEIFTTQKKGNPGVDAFFTEITDLIENQVPTSVQECLEKTGKAITLPRQELNFRVIFSLREEYLPQLEILHRYIPSLRFSRCRVSQLRGIDAEDAVLKPGKEIIKDPEVAVEIIKKIPGSKDTDYNPDEDKVESWENKKIEPFLLSLFCFQVNEKRLEKKAGEISRELINEVNSEGIIKDYYEENIGRFPPGVKIAIEDLLVTAEGYRKLQDLNSLKSGYGVNDNDIEGLIYRRIIRKETRTGIDYVELIHDVLAPILKESRDKRIEEDRRKKEASVKRKRIRRIIAVVTAVILVFLAVLTGFVLYQNAEIKREKQRAEVEGRRAKEEERRGLAYERGAYSIDVLKKDRELSFRLVESAFVADKNNLVAYRALLSVFYDSEIGIYKETVNNTDSEFSKTVSDKADFFAAFSPDGKRILTTVPGKAVLWNLDGTRVKECVLQTETDLKLNPNAAFSPDGKYMVICTISDEQVVLWDLNKNAMTPLPLEGGINSVAFSPGPARDIFAAACRDKKIRLFDLSGKTVKTFTGHTGVVNSVSFSRDGQYIVSAGWDAVRVWDLKVGNQVVKLPINGNAAGVKTGAFSPDGQLIVTAGMDGSVYLWDLKDMKSRTLGKHKGAVTSAVFSPGGEYVLTGSDDRTVRLLTKNNFMVFEFKGFTEIINSASFSPDGKYILIAPARGPARLRLLDPQEIIRLVNRKVKVRPLTEDEKETYNLRN